MTFPTHCVLCGGSGRRECGTMCSCVIVEGGGMWDPSCVLEASLIARKAAKLSWRLPRTELRIDPLDYGPPARAGSPPAGTDNNRGDLALLHGLAQQDCEQLLVPNFERLPGLC